MRYLVCLVAVPMLVVSCAREPLDVDQNSSGVRAEITEKGAGEGSKEAPLIDEPEPDEPMPDEVVMNPDSLPPEQAAPPSLGVDSCQLFAAADQGAGDFESASWQYHVKDCQSSACWDFFSIDNKCSLSFQHDNQMRKASAPEELCRWAAVVFTSPRFESATKACPMVNQPINESFEVTGAVRVRRKFSFCNTPEMEQARDCLRWIVASTFNMRP